MRSNILKSALAVSLESADPQENAELNPVTEETTVVVDEVLEEVREAEEVVETHDEAVDELEEAADSLESLITSLESAIADGGMSPQTAEMYHRGVAIATRRLPIDSADYSVSTESFGGTGDKLVASQEALDRAKEMLSKFWNAIKTAVVNAYNAVVNFIKTLGTGATALKRAAGVLKQRASAIKGEPKNKEIDGKAISAALHTGKDSVTTAGEVVGALGDIVTGARGVIMASNSAATQLKELSAYIATGAGSAAANPVNYAEINKSLPKDELPGGYTIKVGESGIPAFEAGEKKDFTEAKVSVADANGIRNIAQGIEDIAKIVESFSGREFKRVDAEVRKFIKQQDAVVKRMEAEKETKEAIRKELREFRKLSNLARSVGPQYMSYAARSAKAAYAYGMKCAAQYA